MIRLASTPTELALSRLEYCRRRIVEATGAGAEVPVAVLNCYRHPDVKTSIILETAEKCAYCESKITHVYWGDVEHVKPKGRFPECRLDYNNLTIACAICNNKKGDYYNEDAPILNPYDDEPEDHLIGLGHLVWHRNGSQTGQRTIDLLDLNRDGLSERRLERIQRVSDLANRYVNEPEGPVKRVLAAQIRDEAGDTAEYSLAIRSFLVAAYNLHWHAL